MTWITDDRGNRASVERWGSEEKARESLATLDSDCSGCSKSPRRAASAEQKTLRPQEYPRRTKADASWGKSIAPRIAWFSKALDTGRLPRTAFTLGAGIRVFEPEAFYGALCCDIVAGPCGIRGAVVPDDLAAVQAACGPKRIDLRPSSTQRGYGSDWERVRAEHVERFPWCFDCLQLGIETPVAEVDHRPPLSGPDDPGRLDPARLISRCRRHHALITEQDRKLGLTAPWKKSQEDAA